jgi:hypothetical protein
VILSRRSTGLQNISHDRLFACPPESGSPRRTAGPGNQQESQFYLARAVIWLSSLDGAYTSLGILSITESTNNSLHNLVFSFSRASGPRCEKSYKKALLENRQQRD